MKYPLFEWLTIGVGAASIAGTLALSMQPQPDWIEAIAQVMLLAVLVGAVHWGRNGGLVAAILATLAYVVLRIPDVTEAGLGNEIIDLFLIRACTYGLLGIVGGEVCGRIKYFFAGLEDGTSIDETSRVYNQKFVCQILVNGVATATRYGEPFSIALIDLSSVLATESKPKKIRSLVRAVANHIRNDLRLVDDLGRLSDGRFVLILHHTSKAGAVVAADRVSAGLREVIGSRGGTVATSVYGFETDLAAIQELLSSLCAPVPAQAAAISTGPARRTTDGAS